MKTTIELPDEVVRRAKMLAAERRTTLRDLVLQGLEHVLTEKRVTARERAKSLLNRAAARRFRAAALKGVKRPAKLVPAMKKR